MIFSHGIDKLIAGTQTATYRVVLFHHYDEVVTANGVATVRTRTGRVVYRVGGAHSVLLRPRTCGVMVLPDHTRYAISERARYVVPERTRYVVPDSKAHARALLRLGYARLVVVVDGITLRDVTGISDAEARAAGFCSAEAFLRAWRADHVDIKQNERAPNPFLAWGLSLRVSTSA